MDLNAKESLLLKARRDMSSLLIGKTTDNQLLPNVHKQYGAAAKLTSNVNFSMSSVEKKHRGVSTGKQENMKHQFGQIYKELYKAETGTFMNSISKNKNDIWNLSSLSQNSNQAPFYFQKESKQIKADLFKSEPTGQ